MAAGGNSDKEGWTHGYNTPPGIVFVHLLQVISANVGCGIESELLSHTTVLFTGKEEKRDEQQMECARATLKIMQLVEHQQTLPWDKA